MEWTRYDEGELIRLLVYGSASGADACRQAAETACESMAAAYEIIAGRAALTRP